MSAHTPGPWRHMKEGVIIPLKSIYCERLGFQIGFVNTDKKSIEEQARANACLIAAAPELLETLALLMLEVEDSAHVLPQTIRKAQLAIAKAMGEQA